MKFRFLYSCLILALLISQFAVFKFVLNVSAQEPTIFSDGFESGDYSAWSSTTVSGNGALTINSSIVHHGVYSSKSSWSAGGDLAYATKTFANTPVLYVREYVLLQDLPQTGTLTRFLAIRAGTTEMGMIGLERSSAGVLRWTIRYRNNGVLTTTSTASLPSAGQWFCVEYKIQCSSADGQLDGSYILYVNGIQIWSVSNVDTDNIYVNRVDVGLTSTTDSRALALYIDCVVVADAYIGPEVGQTYTVDTSFQTTPTWTVLTQVTFSVLPNWNLQESFTALTQSSFNVIPQWSFQESWNTLTTSVLNIVSGWTSNLQWTLEVLKFGAQFYTVDLTWLTQTTWETLTTNTFNVVNTWSLNPTWTVLTQTTYNIFSNWQTSASWTLDVYHWISTGIVHCVDLTWQTVMEWSSSIFHDVAVVDWGLMALGLAIVAFSLAAVGFVFTRRAKSES